MPISTRNPFKIISNLRFIRLFIKDNKIDIVHCHHRTAAFYMGLLNKYHRVPFVYTLHITPIPHDYFHRLFTFTGNRTIAISDEEINFLKEKLSVPEDRISLVLNGVDESCMRPMTKEEKNEYRRIMGIPEDKIVVSIHSRISDIKNQRSVIEALALLENSVRNKLIVVCSGDTCGDYYTYLRQLIHHNDLENSVVFCGWRGPREVIGISDYMLLPSKSEGFPLNVIEAMFLRVPVIRTKTGGYNNVKDFVVGLDSYHPQCIADCLERIAKQDKLLQEKVDLAYSFAHQNCTLSIMTGKTVFVYKRAIEDVFRNSR